MRIIYVTASFPYGPVEAFVAPELHALLALGHDVRIAPVHPRGARVQSEGPLLEKTWSEGLFPGGGNLVKQSLTAARQIRFFPPVIALSQPRVTIKNLTVVAKGVWLAERARQWHAEHIHAFWSSTPATVAWVGSRIAGIPWSFTTHRWDIYENNLISRKLADACFGRAISALAVRRVKELTGGIDTARLLHLGVDIAEPMPRPRTPPIPPKLLMAANLVPVKGHAIFLQAMSQIQRAGVEVRATCAGDGPLRERLEAETARLGLQDRVEFPGVIPHRQLLERMRAGEWTAVVLASLAGGRGQHEGIPVSLMEAMAAGLPVIATRSGSVEELVSDDVGFPVSPGDPGGLAAAIQRLVTLPDQGGQMGINGYDRVLTDFDARKIARELSDWFSACRGQVSA